MNYTINEIPDEAVELSGNEMIPIWQGETKKVSMATLARYVQDASSYSTTETLTGGTWIDGKPIYRKCYVLQKAITGSYGNTGIPNPYYSNYTGDVEELTNLYLNPHRGISYYPYTIFYTSADKQYITINSQSSPQTYPEGTVFIVEYTKSTD